MYSAVNAKHVKVHLPFKNWKYADETLDTSIVVAIMGMADTLALTSITIEYLGRLYRFVS